ncbi:hypothetical protein LX32DRAFT_339624 [Colletotrichum zoysiae]|uniref:Uncharacterized protein n=1 Tax=Colletotrichum zoysiae TaxID=1216348 RepID=A0AAD9HVK3_9PEZI|nr:hypothetical protein LX32DRAFT_339624 [Colletotrichum zoysiae]
MFTLSHCCQEVQEQACTLLDVSYPGTTDSPASLPCDRDMQCRLRTRSGHAPNTLRTRSEHGCSRKRGSVASASMTEFYGTSWTAARELGVLVRLLVPRMGREAQSYSYSLFSRAATYVSASEAYTFWKCIGNAWGSHNGGLDQGGKVAQGFSARENAFFAFDR